MQVDFYPLYGSIKSKQKSLLNKKNVFIRTFFMKTINVFW